MESQQHCLPEFDCGFADLGYFEVFVLGIVQGITELLPISSTAHLRIVPALLGWKDPGTAFSAAMQLAAFFAVLIYFRKEIYSIATGFISSVFTKNYTSSRFILGLGIILGSIPIGVGGLLLKPILNMPGSPLRSLYVVGVSCLVMSVLMIWVERVGKKIKSLEEITLKECLWVGIAQVGALIPGVSRSGSTLTMGLFLGFKRETAAAFSFILGIPAILAAGMKEMFELHKADLSFEGWKILSFGLTISSLAAFIAVFGLLKYLEKRSTLIFAYYRMAMGIFLIAATYFGFIR